MRCGATRQLAIAAIALVGLAAAHGRANADEMKGEALFSALKNGGYVVYFRHAKSDTSQNDADPIDVNNCATQRGLSEDGRNQARAIGQAFKSLGIGVDNVMSSPYCRAKETGSLAFGRVEPSDSLFYSLGLGKEAAAKAAAQLKETLSRKPAAGKNTVLIGHTSNLKEVAGVWPKTEGAAFVLEPKGDGFAVVGSFSADELMKAGG